MSLLRVVLLGLLLSAGAVGCRRGEVVERIPPMWPLASYRSVSVQVTAAGPVSMHDLTNLHDELAHRLAGGRLLGQVVSQGAPSELVLRATILRRTQEETLFDTGPVELTVGVQLLDNVRRQVVGQFEATSSSNKRPYEGTDDTKSALGDDPDERAMRAVVGEIIRYLEEQTGK